MRYRIVFYFENSVGETITIEKDDLCETYPTIDELQKLINDPEMQMWAKDNCLTPTGANIEEVELH